MYFMITLCQHKLTSKRKCVMKSSIIWDITPCSPLSVTDASEEHIASVLRVEKISSARNQRTLNGLHGVISQKMVLFMTTAVKTSNPTNHNICSLSFKQVESGTYFFRPLRWRRYVPPKRPLTLNGLHGVISQRMVLFITTAVKTSNPAKCGMSLEAGMYVCIVLQGLS
jgi:hypothetical protein